MLEGFLNGEYSMYPETAVEGLLGEIMGLDGRDARKGKAVKKLSKALSRPGSTAAGPTDNLTGKAELERRISMLPPTIQQGLANRSMQITDLVLYFTKKVGKSPKLELMENADVKAVGRTNVNARKLEAGQYFLMTGYSIQSAVNADVSAANYAHPDSTITNGELELKVGSKVLIPKTSLAMNYTTGRNDVQPGYRKVDNPKLVPPQTEIIAELSRSETASATSDNDLCVRFFLHGVTVTKN
jgi:hypothetical protein